MRTGVRWRSHRNNLQSPDGGIHGIAITERKQKQHRRRSEKQRQEDVKALLYWGWIKSGSELPKDAILVNPHKARSTEWGRQFPPCYEDIPFTCVECGAGQLWSAVSRKWYCEVAGGDLASLPLCCRECRKKDRKRKMEARIALGLDAPKSGHAAGEGKVPEEGDSASSPS